MLDNTVFVVCKAATEGFEYFGIFTTPDLARAEADRHPGAFFIEVTLNKSTSF